MNTLINTLLLPFSRVTVHDGDCRVRYVGNRPVAAHDGRRWVIL